MEGLLHLAALAVVLTAGYLGVDKARHGVDEFQQAISKAKLIAGDLVKQLGLGTIDDGNKGRRPSWRSWRTVYPAWVICVAAEVGVTLGLHSWPHFIYRQRYIPCYKFFSKRKDIRMVTWMFAVSAGIFLLLVAETLWPFDLLANDVEKIVLFGALTSIVLIIFFLGFVSFRLMTLDKQFERLSDKVQSRLKKQREDAARLLSDMDS